MSDVAGGKVELWCTTAYFDDLSTILTVKFESIQLRVFE
jgi:hypothetical protein